MTDAEVTAEEVAQWQALFPTGPVARLIAALRTSQAEVERLEPLAEIGRTVLDNAKPAEEVISTAQLFLDILAERDAAKADVEEQENRYDGAVKAVRENRLRYEAAETEVERLTAEINDRDRIINRAFRVDL